MTRSLGLLLAASGALIGQQPQNGTPPPPSGNIQQQLAAISQKLTNIEQKITALETKLSLMGESQLWYAQPIVPTQPQGQSSP